MDKIELTCPKSWSELTQEQLRYTFFLLSTFADKVMVKTYMFVRFTGINVIKKNRFGWQCVYQPEGEKRKRVFYLQLWQIRSFLEQLAWVDSIEQMDNRLDVVQGLEEYLCMEKYYQRFHSTGNDDAIDVLASFLYRNPDFSRPAELTLTPAERLATLAWFAHVKVVMSHAFPHFFRRTESDDDISELSMLQVNTRDI